MYYRGEGKRINQGDIVRDFTYNEGATEEAGHVSLQKRTLDYCVVLTQDCDLEWDFNYRSEGKKNQDKYLHSILVCPAYPSESLKQGIHLDNIGFRMEKFDPKRWSIIKQNNNLRYHFLEMNRVFQIPELVIDFKHYYTIPRDKLYADFAKGYLGTINSLFREQLSQRFAYYLSRIGLPNTPEEEVGAIEDNKTESAIPVSEQPTRTIE